MKNFSPTLLALAILSPVASTDEHPPPEPTALESFVARPAVVLDLAEVVGTLESGGATVAVAAIIATDTARPGERMTGLRFVMTDDTSADPVYLDVAQLALLQSDLADIERGISELESGDAPIRVQGTGACWMPPRPTRILCPSYRVGPDWSGLFLFAYGGRAFNYPNQRPSALAALIGRALARLETR